MCQVMHLKSADKTARARHLIVSFGAVMIAAMIAAPALSDEPSATEFPLVVFCEYQGIAHAYYLSRVGPDGVAVYMTPDRQVGTITAQGTARRISDERSGTCKGKTLSDLRAEGQAFDIAR